MPAASRRGLWGAFIRSGVVLGGDGVFVDEAAEAVLSADRGGWRACPGRRRMPGFGGCEAERAVRPVSVVMVDELAESVP
jgi:hypothetical protein